MKTKTIVVLPDVHLSDGQEHIDYELVKRFLSKNHCDEIVILGDFMDMESLSHWNMSKRRKLEGKRFEKEIETANKELDFLQKCADKVTYIEGNHEYWVVDYIDENPEMEGLIELDKRLNLKRRGIKFVKMNDLYAIGNLYLTHGMYINKYHAQNHLSKLGCNLIYGHSHNTQTAMQNQAMQKPHMAYGLGCLCEHKPDYMKNKPANWISQFAVIYMDSKGNFNVYPINIIEHKFLWGGREYK